jgi:hypothetical protein
MWVWACKAVMVLQVALVTKAPAAYGTRLFECWLLQDARLSFPHPAIKDKRRSMLAGPLRVLEHDTGLCKYS